MSKGNEEMFEAEMSILEDEPSFAAPRAEVLGAARELERAAQLGLAAGRKLLVNAGRLGQALYVQIRREGNRAGQAASEAAMRAADARDARALMAEQIADARAEFNAIGNKVAARAGETRNALEEIQKSRDALLVASEGAARCVVAVQATERRVRELLASVELLPVDGPRMRRAARRANAATGSRRK